MLQSYILNGSKVKLNYDISRRKALMIKVKLTGMRRTMVINPKMILVDLLTPTAVLMGFSAVLIYVLVASYVMGYAYMHFNEFLGHFPAVWVEFALESGFTNKIVLVTLSILTCVAIVFITFVAASTFTVVSSAILTPMLVGHIHRGYYEDVTLNPERTSQSTISSIKIFLSTLTKMVLLGLVSYAMSAVGLGVVGCLIMVFAHYRFCSRNINYQVASSIMRDEEYALFLREGGIPLAITNMMGYFISCVPIVGQYLIAFNVISIAHCMLSWYATNREKIDELYIQDVKTYS